MNEVLHANIFFVIASIGVVIFTILVSLILYQLYKISKLIRKIVERVEAGSEALAEDVEMLRENLNPAKFISFIMGFMPSTKGRKKSKK